MHVTTTPSEKSTVILEVELPATELTRAVADATRTLSQRTRIPGFRPGKAPRSMVERELGAGSVLEEAVDQLVERSYRAALAEQAELFVIGRPTINVVQADEGQPVVMVRGLRWSAAPALPGAALIRPEAEDMFR